MLRRAVCFTTFGFLLVRILPGVSTSEWYVDGLVEKSGSGKAWKEAFKTIHEGISAASDKDTVIVAEGIYVENIHFGGRNITLRSKNPLDEDMVWNTIIDGNEAGTVVTFAGTEDKNCTLSGFRIRNGRAMYGGGISGGTGQTGTQATIENNIILENFADYGGGIRRCDGIIRDNTIRDNSAYWGGGLDICNGEVQDNTITGNTVTQDGGGLRNCNAAILNNTVRENTAGGKGGGLYRCGGAIQNNNIGANTASGDGGGLWDCDGMIWNNTISGNDAGGYGGGLYGCDGTIRNNAIAFNGTDQNGAGLSQCHGTIESNTVRANSASGSGGGLSNCSGYIINCIITANTAHGVYESRNLHETSLPTYSCLFGTSPEVGGEGNIFEDPECVVGFHQLRSQSPCIDAGRNEEWMWDAVDLDDHSRVFPYRSARVDMGAYEYVISSFKLFITRSVEGEPKLVWRSQPGKNYVVWSCFDLATMPWADEEAVPSQGYATTWTDPFNTTPGRKYYRIEQE